MASQEPPLDEIQWRSPETAQRMGGIHENSVLYYFAESPFFDKIANNHTLVTQGIANLALRSVLETRQAFEGRLDQMSGLEFRVAYGPQDFGPEAYPGLGRWVIRKQERRKRSGVDDDVTVLASYFVVGENIYMAPAVGDVIWSKMLTATRALHRLLALASPLAKFSPALGHHYIDPTMRSQKPSSASRRDSEASSAIGSPIPGRSRETTPLPSSSQTQLGLLNKSATTGTQTADSADAQMLLETFEIFRRYGHEYLDTHPLVGEPGSFGVAATKPPTLLQVPSMKIGPDLTQNDVAGSTPRPPGVASDGAQFEEKQGRQPGDPPKSKRRKSKALGSPSIPLTTIPT